jgi:cell division septation protein DedD
MIKYLFIVINSLCLFVFGLFSEDNGITVTHTLPVKLVAGQEVPFELKINKGGMNGFGKLQLELPEGIIVKESEEKGANYSYALGMAKWVWAALPMESEIIVKITLYVEETTIGAKTISAKYSFVVNNEKQVVEMIPAELDVLAPGSIVEKSAISTKTTTNSDSLALANSSIVPLVNTAVEPQKELKITRTISAVSSTNDFLITLKIQKDGTKGFARFSDDVAEDITVKAVKTDGGSFSVADGKLKFVWVNVPEKEELEISYTISGNTSNVVMLGGEYSYLEDNQSKKCKAGSETISFQTAQLSNETKQQKVKPADPELVVPATTESVEASIANKLGETNLPNFSKKNTVKLNYQVQVGAFTNAKVTSKKLKKKFKINEKINSEMQAGFSKFMIGSHTEYKDARNQRETMQKVNGVKSAFVVAYNEGKRITVQEALMITNQKWFK